MVIRRILGRTQAPCNIDSREEHPFGCSFRVLQRLVTWFRSDYRRVLRYEILDSQVVRDLNSWLQIQGSKHLIEPAGRQSIEIESAVLALLDHSVVAVNVAGFIRAVGAVGFRRLKRVKGL